MTTTQDGVTTPTFPPGRYGRRRERRAAPRWLRPVLIVVVVVAGLAVAAGYYQRFGASDYEAVIVRSQPPTATRVVLTLRVTKPAGRAAECVVRSRSRSGAEVGRASVAVPAGGPDSTSVDVTYALRTSSTGLTAEVAGCGPAH